jgi:hypothetical protein
MSSVHPEGGQLIWRKAQRSMNNGDCVEVATTDGKIAVRDSKNPNGGWMIYSPRCWQTFVAKVKVG